MRSVIIVYSATGNSLKVAKAISDGEIHFVEEVLSGRYMIPEDTERLGIVFPVNCFGIPYPIQRLISECLAERDNSALGYIYAIATYGGIESSVMADLETELTGIGCALSYGASVRLPDAYLPLQKKAVGEIGALAALNKVQSKIEKIADDIEREEISIPRRAPFRRLRRRLSRMGTKPERNRKLTVEDRCTGCGICRRICPMENIAIENGKAVLGESCISCFACYHRCPENALSYPGAKGQYKGFVSTEELFKR